MMARITSLANDQDLPCDGCKMAETVCRGAVSCQSFREFVHRGYFVTPPGNPTSEVHLMIEDDEDAPVFIKVGGTRQPVVIPSEAQAVFEEVLEAGTFRFAALQDRILSVTGSQSSARRYTKSLIYCGLRSGLLFNPMRGYYRKECDYVRRGLVTSGGS